MIFNIAIDGPAGAGKSTVAKQVAGRLGCVYVDTGAMYRAMALYMLRQGLDGTDAEAIAAACPGADITIEYKDGVQNVLLNGENVNADIRTEEVGTMASISSAVPAVRARLLTLQRQLAASMSVVMDGRDIGTTILPEADVKIFLTASSRTRAERRFKELQEKGVSCELNKIQADIEERDKRDMEREISPLRRAEDAVLVDSSSLTIEEVTDRILKIFREKTEGREKEQPE